MEQEPQESATRIPPPPGWNRPSTLDAAAYEALYQRSIAEPEAFWAEQAESLHWFQRWDQVLEADFARGQHRWFRNGQLNACYNCLDRHLEGPLAGQKALIWEGDDPQKSSSLTYRALHKAVCRLANVLKRRGVQKGDRVTIYMPMVPELTMAVLACARIGAVHSVVFGGFSPEALADRILDCQSSFVLTADQGLRGGRSIPLKANCDAALEKVAQHHQQQNQQRQGEPQDEPVRHCLVLKLTHAPEPVAVTMKPGRDLWWHEELAAPGIDAPCPPEPMDAEDPLFILYTSGSTGKPKGVLHTTAGYLLYASLTHRHVFDYQPGDVHWCTADLGWITGHSYIVYGPLCNGATTLMFEGVPSYPDAGRFWDVCDKHAVNIFYTAPTALRALMREGDQHITRRRLESLRLLGTVGEPINPQVWRWYHEVVGKGRLPIVDTWWQTETGGILITPLPGATELKPGSATRPFFGIKPVLLDDEGQRIEGAGRGNLCLESPWPGLMRRVYGDPNRFYETYFARFPGYYFSGDGCRRDEDGYYWITGRVDDVINVSGHRLGTAEIESALVSHTTVAEAAVVGMPHAVKGQGIYAYVTLKVGVEPSEALLEALRGRVREEIGPIATPDRIQWAGGLPKTRSGKIMRRILRKIAAEELDNVGDTSTLADPSVVHELIEQRRS